MKQGIAKSKSFNLAIPQSGNSAIPTFQ